MLGLCEKFHCLPSQLRAESAEILRLITIQNLGTPEPTANEGGDDYGESD